MQNFNSCVDPKDIFLRILSFSYLDKDEANKVNPKAKDVNSVSDKDTIFTGPDKGKKNICYLKDNTNNFGGNVFICVYSSIILNKVKRKQNLH